MSEAMFSMWSQNQELKNRLEKLEQKQSYREPRWRKTDGKSNKRDKKKKEKKKKNDYSPAQKIKWYSGGGGDWNSKITGMINRGVVSGYLTPEQWFRSEAYRVQQSKKGEKKKATSSPMAMPTGMSFPVIGSQTGVQGSLTKSVLTNNPGMTPMQAGVQNPGAVPVHATSS